MQAYGILIDDKKPKWAQNLSDDRRYNQIPDNQLNEMGADEWNNSKYRINNQRCI